MGMTHKLRNLKAVDAGGSPINDVVEIYDDGPFPGDGGDANAHKKGSPSGGRQRTVGLLAKRDDQGQPIWGPLTDVSTVFANGAFLDIPVVAPFEEPKPPEAAPAEIVPAPTGDLAPPPEVKP